MFGLGTKEIVIIAIVLVILFGAKKIPDLANGIAEGVRTLKKSFGGEDNKKEEKK